MSPNDPALAPMRRAVLAMVADHRPRLVNDVLHLVDVHARAPEPAKNLLREAIRSMLELNPP